MHDSQALTEIQKLVKNERAFLPVSVLLASAVAFVVVWYRLAGCGKSRLHTLGEGAKLRPRVSCC